MLKGGGVYRIPTSSLRVFSASLAAEPVWCELVSPVESLIAKEDTGKSDQRVNRPGYSGDGGVPWVFTTLHRTESLARLGRDGTGRRSGGWEPRRSSSMSTGYRFLEPGWILVFGMVGSWVAAAESNNPLKGRHLAGIECLRTGL